SAAAVSPSAGAAVSAAVSAASVSVEPVEPQPANRDATIRQARSSATNFFIIHSPFLVQCTIKKRLRPSAAVSSYNPQPRLLGKRNLPYTNNANGHYRQAGSVQIGANSRRGTSRCTAAGSAFVHDKPSLHFFVPPSGTWMYC